MDEPNWKLQVRKHLVLTRRIRGLDPRKDSPEFAEGRLNDYAARVAGLLRLLDQVEDDQGILSGAIAVSLNVHRNKCGDFKLPVAAGGFDQDEDMPEMDEGGFPVRVPRPPFTLSGSGARTFADSHEWNDW